MLHSLVLEQHTVPMHNAAPGTNSSLRQEQMNPEVGKGEEWASGLPSATGSPSTQGEQLQKPCGSPGSSFTQLQVEECRPAHTMEFVMKALSQNHIQSLFWRATVSPLMKMQQKKPFMSALYSKRASHLLLRHIAVHGLEENLPAASLI